MKRVLEPGNRSQRQRRLVLGGMGGVGKTQLAIAYASHCQHEYDSVFCLNAKSEATLKDSFRKVAAEIVFDIQDPGVVNSEEVLIHIRRWLSHQKNSQWLLIFDNYDEPEQYKIENYYPPASHGAIVVTTRLPRLVAGRPILIKSLKETEESLEVLRTRSERENVTSGMLPAIKP
jgi:GTPase SAR1 family protein